MLAKVEIIGYLGRDPEMRYTPQGQAVTSFSVATSYSYKDSAGEKVTITTWWQVSAWGKTGEICNQYLKKGGRVYIEGRLNPDKKTGRPRIWQKTDGSPGASYELTAGRVLFLSDRHEAEAAGGLEEPAVDGFEAGPDDDVPF